jgi:predicted dithiol-disulfide oxidoreductase (DUF899 family)
MNDEIASLQQQICELKQQLVNARRSADPEPVKDYTLKTPDGQDVQLSELFGDQNDLLVVHNMGKGCVYCTLWADGFVSMADHLNSRAAFVLCSYDDPAKLKEFASSRSWTYRTVSNAGSEFAREMGFVSGDSPQPGVSAFHKNDDGSIVRTGSAPFGPGDDFCAAWAFFDLLKDGPGDWAPKYSY